MAKPETVSEVLNAAADLLMRTGWCQKHYATNGRGVAVSQRDPSAQRFCALGAIDCVAGGRDGVRLSSKAIDSLGRYIRGGVSQWNDCRCFRRAQVVSAMREAAKAEGTHQ